jgi:hypothetical protein
VRANEAGGVAVTPTEKYEAPKIESREQFDAPLIGELIGSAPPPPP